MDVERLLPDMQEAQGRLAAALDEKENLERRVSGTFLIVTICIFDSLKIMNI